MFEHKFFDHYNFENIPLNQDFYLVDEIFMKEYEQAMLKQFREGEYETVGYVSHVAVRKINKNSLELSWYANFSDRFHDIIINLPKEQFVDCIGCWKYDESPSIFVKSDWYESIYLRSYSIFAMIDAINVKKALESGQITRVKLIELRNEIDNLSKKYQDISFISFADSILLKSNWTVGYFKSPIKYTYEPETFIYLVDKINATYESILGLKTYAIITQGSNEYYDDPLLHVSKSKNHISLNSLGIPFALLMEIESDVRKEIKKDKTIASDLYMDEQYYHSLNFKFDFVKNKHNEPNKSYDSKITGLTKKYYYLSRNRIISNLKEKDKSNNSIYEKVIQTIKRFCGK